MRHEPRSMLDVYSYFGTASWHMLVDHKRPAVVTSLVVELLTESPTPRAIFADGRPQRGGH